tara:strand:- start:360 stop:635 length:276 start_codon:yes stop_codon:yes gene_type:complete
MNICFTSTFQGTFDDFKNIMDEAHVKYPEMTEGKPESAELPYERAGWCKVVTIAHVIDFDKMQAAMSEPWMVEWDEKHNNTDVIYSMEEMA